VSRAKFALGVPVALAVSMVEFNILRRAKPHPVGLASIPAAVLLADPAAAARLLAEAGLDPARDQRRRLSRIWGKKAA
jgi:hypothetical protein